MKFLFYLSFCLFPCFAFSASNCFELAHSFKTMGNFDYTKISSYRVVEISDACTIIELRDENGAILLNVIAAVATAFLPETLEAVCERTVGNPDICNTVYNVTSALVDIAGVGIYKGSAKGLRWLASRGKKKSYGIVETNSYEIASGVKTVFELYKKECTLGKGIPWEDVDYAETADIVKQLEAKSTIVQLFNAWEKLDLFQYLNQWDKQALQYTKTSTRNYSQIRSSRTSFFEKLKSVDVLNYDMKVTKLNDTEARITVIYSMRFTYTSGKVFNEYEVEEMYILKYHPSLDSWKILKNYDYINK